MFLLTRTLYLPSEVYCASSTQIPLLDLRMLPRLFSIGRNFVTGGRNPLASAPRPGEPLDPTVQTSIEAKNAVMSGASGDQLDVATVASGCFWGTEHIYREYFGNGKGLLDAKVGFIGGKESSKNPSYEEVCTGRTGHAEATQIKFDPVCNIY